MATALPILAALLLATSSAGCAGDMPDEYPGSATASPSRTSPSGAPSPGVSPAAGPDVTLCRQYVRSAPAARQSLELAAREPVLAAGVALTLIGTRQVAASGGNAQDPALRAAFAELQAALDDVGHQANAQVPPGGNPADTKVRIQPARAQSALDGAYAACRTKGVTAPR